MWYLVLFVLVTAYFAVSKFVNERFQRHQFWEYPAIWNGHDSAMKFFSLLWPLFFPIVSCVEGTWWWKAPPIPEDAFQLQRKAPDKLQAKINEATRVLENRTRKEVGR